MSTAPYPAKAHFAALQGVIAVLVHIALRKFGEPALGLFVPPRYIVAITIVVQT